MISDAKNRGKSNVVPKHKTRIPEERFWLKGLNEVDLIQHANISRQDLLAENKRCWDVFYSVREVVKRVLRGRPATWSLAGKFTYLLFCMAFQRIYGGQGMAADGVRRNRLGFLTKTIGRVGIATYNHFFRKEKVGVGQPWAR